MPTPSTWCCKNILHAYCKGLSENSWHLYKTWSLQKWQCSSNLFTVLLWSKVGKIWTFQLFKEERILCFSHVTFDYIPICWTEFTASMFVLLLLHNMDLSKRRCCYCILTTKKKTIVQETFIVNRDWIYIFSAVSISNSVLHRLFWFPTYFRLTIMILTGLLKVISM